MSEILFGWIIKGKYEVSLLDHLVMLIEIMGLIILWLCVSGVILWWRNLWKKN